MYEARLERRSEVKEHLLLQRMRIWPLITRLRLQLQGIQHPLLKAPAHVCTDT